MKQRMYEETLSLLMNWIKSELKFRFFLLFHIQTFLIAGVGRFYHCAAETMLFQSRYGCNRSAAWRTYPILQRSWMFPRFKNHFSASHHCLSCHTICRISGKTVFYRAVRQRFDKHINVCRRTSAGTDDCVNQPFLYQLHGSEGFKKCADHRFLLLGEFLPVIADSSHSHSHQGRRIRHRSDNSLILPQSCF